MDYLYTIGLVEVDNWHVFGGLSDFVDLLFEIEGSQGGHVRLVGVVQGFRSQKDQQAK